MTIELITLVGALASAVVAILSGMFALFAFYSKRIDHRFVKVDERFEKLETKMDERFEKLETKMDKRFEKVDKRFEKVDEQLASVHRDVEKNAVAIARIEGPQQRLYVR